MSPYTKIGNIQLSDQHPTRVMGIINVSPESFFKGSIYGSGSAIRKAAEKMVLEGVDILDIGARSTAPYLETNISVTEEMQRITTAIKEIKQITDTPISADTCIGDVAEAAFQAGATILNDVSGLAHDKQLVEAAKKYDGVLLMANANYTDARGEPVEVVTRSLQAALHRAEQAGIGMEKIVIDPGIGFFRNQQIAWDRWDRSILHNLDSFRSLNVPLMISVSRKSFIGKVLEHKDPHDRLFGSLAVTTYAVLHKVQLIRTHDVLAARDAARMAAWLI
jgi:dihydropteroate synthase